MISMTTDSVLPRERAEFWTDLVSRHVTPMCIEPAGEQPLSGKDQVQVIGDLGVAQVSGRGVHASHTRAQIARTRGHLYAACVHLGGEARISRLSEQIALQKGDVLTASPPAASPRRSRLPRGVLAFEQHSIVVAAILLRVDFSD